MNKVKPSQYMIAWIKWIEEESENDWTKDGISYEDQNESSYEDDETPQIIAGMQFPFMKPIMPVKIITEKDFNFWMGHTNFPISSPILDLIMFCPGAEAIDVLTSYRFRIAIGLLFKPNEVMAGVTQAVIGYLQAHDNEEIQSDVHK